VTNGGNSRKRSACKEDEKNRLIWGGVFLHLPTSRRSKFKERGGGPRRGGKEVKERDIEPVKKGAVDVRVVKGENAGRVHGGGHPYIILQQNLGKGHPGSKEIENEDTAK